jgi:predicted alpha/beta superfamily hydrolase
MIKQTILFSFFILCVRLQVSFVQSDRNDIVIGKKSYLHSATLNQERELLVYLPATYTDNFYTRYPVIYLLDSGKFFNSFSSTVGQLRADASPKFQK